MANEVGKFPKGVIEKQCGSLDPSLMEKMKKMDIEKIKKSIEITEGKEKFYFICLLEMITVLRKSA